MDPNRTTHKIIAQFQSSNHTSMTGSQFNPFMKFKVGSKPYSIIDVIHTHTQHTHTHTHTHTLLPN